jgi:hypothetical protein
MEHAQGSALPAGKDTWCDAVGKQGRHEDDAPKVMMRVV